MKLKGRSEGGEGSHLLWVAWSIAVVEVFVEAIMLLGPGSTDMGWAAGGSAPT